MSTPRHHELCTLFDSHYLLKGLALYASLERHCPSFTLTVYTFDERAEELLGRLDLPHLRTVSLARLEADDPALASVKGTRSRGEYCWTATPALPLHVLRTRPEVEAVTYLDADLRFWDDPGALIDELGDDSVLITEHRYPPQYARHLPNGIYNVQFMTFRRDARGLEVLQWWHDRCVEWCYARLEDGRFGDQKYLDDWPERFAGVHVLRHPGGGVAPWNVVVAGVHEGGDGTLRVGDGQPLVFFHFHGAGLRRDGALRWRVPGFSVPRAARTLLYERYRRDLTEALARVRAVEPGFDAGLEAPPTLPERLDLLKRDAIERALAVRERLR